MSSQPEHPGHVRYYGLGRMLRQLWERSLGSVSLVLVYVCVTLFLVIAVLDLTGLCVRNQVLSLLGLSYVGVFQQCWVHQFVTAPLMHGNIAHLLFNMLALWMLGPVVEQVLGRWRYILFSMLCAGASMVGWLLFAWGTGNIVMGYSGVIFGILVAQARFFPDQMIFFYAFFPLKMKHAVLIMAAVELYLTVSPEQPGVANVAHLFGAVAAFVYLRLVKTSDARVTILEDTPKPAAKPRQRKTVDRREIPTEL